MLVTIDIEENLLAPIIKEHLETGLGVQNYIIAAITYFNNIRKLSKAGDTVGVTRDEYMIKKLVTNGIDPEKHLAMWR